jgi:hypothetical protein
LVGWSLVVGRWSGSLVIGRWSLVDCPSIVFVDVEPPANERTTLTNDQTQTTHD